MADEPVKVLVTGAGGFVGRNLVPSLRDAGHEVIGLVHDAAQLETIAGVTALERDLADPDGLDDLPDADVIVHLAQANARFPEGARDLFAVNAASTERLLDHARRCGAARFVYASSGSIYGFRDTPAAEDEPLRAADFYSATKIASERLLAAYAGLLDTVILRLFTPYGPGQTGRLVPNLVARVLAGREIVLNAGGRPRMNPIYVDDLVGMLLAAVEARGSLVVNIAGDEVVDIKTLGELIGRALDREPAFTMGDADVPGDLVGDNARMHEVFRVGPLVPLVEGLARTVRHDALREVRA